MLLWPIVSRKNKSSNWKFGSCLCGALMSSYTSGINNAKLNESEWLWISIFWKWWTLSVCLPPSFSFFLPHLLAPLCNLCLCHLWHQPAHPHLCQTWQTQPNQNAQLGAVQLTRLSSCTSTLIFKACEFDFVVSFPLKRLRFYHSKLPHRSSQFGYLLQQNTINVDLGLEKKKKKKKKDLI